MPIPRYDNERLESLDFDRDYRYETRRVKEVKHKVVAKAEKEPDPKWIERIIIKQQKPVKKTVGYRKYNFYTFYHPYVCSMITQLNRYGIEGLLNPKTGTEKGEELLRQVGNSGFSFKDSYAPAAKTVADSYPEEGFDFDYNGPYGIYNWELFFHAPLMIADRLSQNQKFEDAREWFHYIFDPTATEGPAPQRYWKVKPFYEYHDESNINAILQKMEQGEKAFNRQLNQWMKNPFKPHIIARLRIVAYMKTVVMKYLDNLIAWGDQLFRRDSIESINEATQLYILAADILGPKPNRIRRQDSNVMTVGNVVMENANPLGDTESELGNIDTDDSIDIGDGLNSLKTLLLFCTSPNDKLLGYWDTIADRLFKIRNCQNIEGITRSLALFEPPIDPALLVKAAASGLDIGQVLDSVSGILPYYRFRYLIQKSLDLCNDVKALGGALLSALEKKDAEELALLRAGHEVTLLKAVRQLRQRSIEEAKENIASLETSKELITMRLDYYSSREYMNAHEQKQLDKMEKAITYQNTSSTLTILASALALIPGFKIGVSGAFGSPVATSEITGGKYLFNSLNAVMQGLNALASIENQGASKAGIKGGYDRRMDDWQLQASLAEKEIEQIDKQITAAQIRLAMAETELKNHDLQTAQAQEANDFMQDKYTNAELYDWMIKQISSLLRQGYQLAFDVARKAEKAFQYELAIVNEKPYIVYDYGSNLKKGLLSGERLQADIRRMEIAYMDQNKREYELTKHVPLSITAPDQLVRLRRDGICNIQVPEVLFDLDHPGQYMRRIKSVSITIPGVTGPYTNVNARLTMLSNRVRSTASVGESGYGYSGLEDPRFRHDVAGIQSIATSSGQNDSGLFELNFQDERYLPFEGAGAISTWQLELPGEFRQFDYDTIADVILHINYTAREGGNQLKSAATGWVGEGLDYFADELQQNQTGMQRVFSLKTHFPNTLYQLLQSVSGETWQEADFVIRQEHFPHFLRDRALSLSGDIQLMLQLRDGTVVNDPAQITLALSGANALPVPVGSGVLTVDTDVLPLPYLIVGGTTGSPVDEWTLRAESPDTAAMMNTDEVEDIYIIMNYTIN